MNDDDDNRDRSGADAAPAAPEVSVELVIIGAHGRGLQPGQPLRAYVEAKVGLLSASSAAFEAHTRSCDGAVAFHAGEVEEAAEAARRKLLSVVDESRRALQAAREAITRVVEP